MKEILIAISIFIFSFICFQAGMENGKKECQNLIPSIEFDGISTLRMMTQVDAPWAIWTKAINDSTMLQYTVTRDTLNLNKNVEE